jgi:phosphoglycolate phosphatase-like HAD superfamily hydrolase
MRRKPDPQPLLFACASLQVAPAQTLMVGDSTNDVQAARRGHSGLVRTARLQRRSRSAHTAL